MTDSGTDALRILELQRAAQRREGAPSAKVRRERLKSLADMVRAGGDEFAAAISADFGNRSWFETALLETMVTLSAIRHARRNVGWWMRPSDRDVDITFWPGSAWVRREPLGVIGIISPWNYPLQLALSPLVDALAAGNRAVIKPSEQTPKFSELLKQKIKAAFSEDVVSVVTGGPEVAAAFSRLPFDHLVFTGSTSIGRQVAQATADGLVPTTLELGGKSPALICPSGSIDKAAAAIAQGKFVNAGQTCIAPDYVLAPRGEVDDVAAKIMAEAARAYPQLGDDYSSLISERAFDRAQAAVEEAERGGARVLRHATPADRAKRLMPPTVVLNSPADGALMREEIFAPILPIIGYDTLDQALNLIASRPDPLALYIFAENTGEQGDVLDRTRSGGVTINATLLHIAQEDLPFGGIGPSGMGHYHGRAGFDRFTHARAVFRTGWFNAANLLAPPYGERAKRLLKILMR
ncbi:MAG: coniferyl aldehyde dehydrogenase [Hyphomonadaceae bacterium]|nr:coniferyl aldehyde dehydrogenase [Hyphomonadaceae bacterium]